MYDPVPTTTGAEGIGDTVGYQSVVGSYFEDASGGLLQEIYFRMAIEGSKQPQDFGVNAHLGGQASVNWAMPLLEQHGVGLQAGTSINATGNAVRVYELLGETTGRTQSYTTVGMFQRTDSGFAWGFVHDFLYQKFYDQFSMGQWRFRASYDLNPCNQIGFTGIVGSYDDTGTFGGGTDVRLSSIDQMHVYWRHYWETGAQTSFWVGIADGHGEDNAVTGFSPPKDESFLFGADVLMPLNDCLAIYGETNLMMPADTGTVDAFLGLQWYPRISTRAARRNRFSPLFEVASPVSFSTDLTRL